MVYYDNGDLPGYLYDQDRLNEDYLRAQAYIDHIIDDYKVEKAKQLREEASGFEQSLSTNPLSIATESKRIHPHVNSTTTPTA